MQPVHESDGFTLLEVMIATALASIITLGAYALFSAQYKIDRTNQKVEEQREAAMYAINALVHDLRMIGYNNGANEDITYADSTRIDFVTDWNNDSTMESYSFAFSGSKLRKNGTTFFDQLNIQSFGFSYFDANGNLLSSTSTSSDRAEIREIGIEIKVKPETSSSDVGQVPTITFRNRVRPRNVGID